MVVGGGVDDFKKYFPQDSSFRKGLYRLSFLMHLVEIGFVMKERFPEDRISVYYDQSREFGPVAKKAFDSFKEDAGVSYLSKYFLTMTPIEVARMYPTAVSRFPSL